MNRVTSNWPFAYPNEHSGPLRQLANAITLLFDSPPQTVDLSRNDRGSFRNHRQTKNAGLEVDRKTNVFRQPLNQLPVTL